MNFRDCISMTCIFLYFFSLLLYFLFSRFLCCQIHKILFRLSNYSGSESKLVDWTTEVIEFVMCVSMSSAI